MEAYPTNMRAVLSQDEVVTIVSMVDDTSLPSIAAVAHAWRSAAVTRLAALSFLRPATGRQRIASGLKANGPKGRPEPTFLAVIPGGDVVLAESSLHRLAIFRAGECQRTIGSFGIGSTTQGLHYPKGVAVDDEANIYVADRSNHRVVKYGPDGTFAGSLGKRGYGVGQFKYPQGAVFVRSTAHGPLIFVADYGNDRVVAVGCDLTWCFTFGDDLGPSFALPAGIAIGRCPPTKPTDPTETGCTSTEQSVSSPPAEEPPVVAARVNPTADAQWHSSELYVVDASNGVVHVHNPSTGKRLRILGPLGALPREGTCGACCSAGEEWPELACRVDGAIDGDRMRWAVGQFEFPWGCCCAHGKLYVSEGAASGGRYGAIQAVDVAHGKVLQTVELPRRGRVSGLATDGAGNVLAIDHDDRSVRLLSTSWCLSPAASGASCPMGSLPEAPYLCKRDAAADRHQLGHSQEEALLVARTKALAID